ncbi:MAG: hypothetical protein Ct9H300mP25_16860 [Acidobacteriota bacterium]|nr:MAG: hypothetical protein Ct9H300mP25_16860 [Acidobacteriota bacterium]
MLAGDNELGHVYLPTGTTTNDYYGADRPGDNLFSETIIAVDVESGQRVWHFQAVHHGLWDYDFPTHSNLVDVVVDGKPIKALVQVSNRLSFMPLIEKLVKPSGQSRKEQSLKKPICQMRSLHRRSHSQRDLHLLTIRA